MKFHKNKHTYAITVVTKKKSSSNDNDFWLESIQSI